MKRLLILAALAAAPLLPAADLPYMWGENGYGQLGDGGTTHQAVPVATDSTGVLAGKSLLTGVTGWNRTCVVDTNGNAYSWGASALGNATVTSSSVPVAVTMNGLSFTAVAVGSAHVLALTDDGKVFAWGRNYNGQLGTGDTTDCTEPTAVNMSGVLHGERVVGIAASQVASFAVTASGKVAAWGGNLLDGLGDGSGTDQPLPVLVGSTGIMSGKHIIKIAAGFYYTLALASDGTLFGWGYGEMMGTSPRAPLPVAMDQTGTLAMVRIADIIAGSHTAFVLSDTGRLYSWGQNYYGELGIGSTSNDSTSPVAVDPAGSMGGRTIKTVAAGFRRVVAIAEDGSVWAWGYNPDGLLATGSPEEKVREPEAVTTTGVLSGLVPIVPMAGWSSCGVLAGPASSGAATTSTFAFTGRRSYGANFGWMNWRWSSGAAEAPALTSNVLHGKVYCANAGWLHLGDGAPDDGVRYSQTNGDIGVNHDGAGALTGYAYAASFGWVTFAQSWQHPPRLNLTSGEMSGYAYSANCGWIRLDGLRTTLRRRDADLAGAGDGIDDAWEHEQLAAAGRPDDLGLLGAAPGADADSDGFSDLDEYLADTNPFSATARPGGAGFTGSSADTLTLEWPASSRRTWQIEGTADLAAWNDVGSPLTIPAGSSTGSATVTLPPAAQRLFFRVTPQVPLAAP